MMTSGLQELSENRDTLIDHNELDKKMMESVMQLAIKTLIEEECGRLIIDIKNLGLVERTMINFFNNQEDRHELQSFCNWVGCEFNAYDFAELCIEQIRM